MAYNKPSFLRAEEGLAVGQTNPAIPESRLLQVPGAEGLQQFPPPRGCPDEVVEQRVPCSPSERMAENGLQVFSLWSELPITVNTPAFEAQQFLRSPPSPGGGSQLWMVDLWAWEVQRELGGALPGLSPLGQAQILDNRLSQGLVPGLGILNGGSQSSKLKARLSMHRSSGGTVRVVDIGQGIRMAIEACMIEVEILYPRPGFTTTVQSENPPTLGGTVGGLVLDTIVGGLIVPTTSTPGDQSTTNTITTTILAGEQDLTLPVPPGARSVTIYQTGDGDVLTMEWRLERSDPAASGGVGPSLGQIVVGNSRRVQRMSRPGNAGMITTGAADVTTNRVVTMVWELEI